MAAITKINPPFLVSSWLWKFSGLELDVYTSFRRRPYGLMGEAKGMESRNLALIRALPLSNCVTSDTLSGWVISVFLNKIRLIIRTSWSCYLVVVVVLFLVWCDKFLFQLFFKIPLAYSSGQG